MQRKTRKFSPLSLAVISAMGFSMSAGAQVLEEVVVTAQKKAENLTEAPVAVTLVSAQEISDLSVFQADELNKLVSGMEIRYEGDSRTGVGLRGMGTFQQQSAPARVGTYMDDYYMASQAAFALGSLYDMSDVQVLKGPQGTLYGQPSPTGALVLRSADPNFDGINGYVQGSIVDPKGYNLQGGVNFPIGDSFAVRLAGLTDDRETGTENVVRNLDEDRNRDAARIKLLWEPTENFSAKVGYHYMESNNSGTYRAVETVDSSMANFDSLKPKDRIAIADARSEMLSRKDNFWTLNLNWLVGDVELTWFSGNLQSKQKITDDNDRTDQPLLVLDTKTEYGRKNEALQNEFRASSTAFDIWDWTVGAYHGIADSLTEVVAYQHIVGQGVFPFSLDIPIEATTKAIFTHNVIGLGTNTDLTIGVRYNEFEQDAGNVQSGDFLFGSEMLPGGEITDPVVVIENAFPCVDGTQSPCVLSQSSDVDKWTGTIKLSHFFGDYLNLYGTLDKGYRPGAPNFDTTGVFSPDLNQFDGESVESIEIGAKGDILDGRARYTAALFYSVYEDYQVQAQFEAYNVITGELENTSNPPWVNVDEAVQWGIEADFQMLVTANWSFYTGFTYTNVEFTDGEIPCTDPSQPPVGPDNRYNTCDADGENASAQPEWTANLRSEYTFPQVFGQTDAYVSGVVAYRGDTEVPGDSTGRFDTDDFTTLDLYTGLRSASWSLQLFAKNVTDEDGVLARAPATDAYNALTLVAPRTYGLTASYNF